MSGSSSILLQALDIRYALNEYFGFLKDKEIEERDSNAGSLREQIQWRIQDLEGLDSELARKLLWIAETCDSLPPSRSEEFIRTCEEAKKLLEARTFRVKLFILSIGRDRLEFERLRNQNTWLFRHKNSTNFYTFSKIKARSYPSKNLPVPFLDRFFPQLFRWKTVFVWVIIACAFYYFPFMTHGTWSGIISFITITLGLTITVPSIVSLLVEKLVQLLLFCAIIIIGLYCLTTYYHSNTKPSSLAPKIIKHK